MREEVVLPRRHRAAEEVADPPHVPASYERGQGQGRPGEDRGDQRSKEEGGKGGEERIAQERKRVAVLKGSRWA